MKDVQSHGGTVLEFLGDGMLAVFGAPNDIPDHAAQAVKCLQTMTARGCTKLGFRGGVHSGEVVAGNLGSSMQMKYTVVGDAVNVAARLEQLNKSLGSTVAISGDTYAKLPSDLKKWVNPRGRHLVKGRNQSVDVYTHGSIPSSVPKRSRRLSLH